MFVLWLTLAFIGGFISFPLLLYVLAMSDTDVRDNY